MKKFIIARFKSVKKNERIRMIINFFAEVKLILAPSNT